MHGCTHGQFFQVFGPSCHQEASVHVGLVHDGDQFVLMVGCAYVFVLGEVEVVRYSYLDLNV